MRCVLCLHSQPESLAVVVRGLGSSLYLKDVLRTISEIAPKSDILVPKFDSRLWSQQDAESLAGDLSKTIEQVLSYKRSDLEAGYGGITLIGHSIGAALVLSAWLRSLAAPPSESHSWARNVNRIVMLAGLTEGWTAPTAASVGLFRSWKFRALISFAKYLGLAQFMISTEAGSPFITRLHAQWRAIAQTGCTMPLLIQLRGEDDWLTSSISGFPKHSLLVSDTGHFDIGVFSAITADEISKRLQRGGFGNLFFRSLTNRPAASRATMDQRRLAFISTLAAGHE